MPSHQVLAVAIAETFIEGGLKPDNIIIWERAESTLKGAGLSPVLYKAHFIKTSAGMGLGANDPKHIDIVSKVVL